MPTTFTTKQIRQRSRLKPHIKKSDDPGVWMCQHPLISKEIGFGNTPKEAYQHFVRQTFTKSKPLDWDKW